ncbi:MAG: TIGR01777 family oxidoreductase [Cyanobacteriota bacterium]|nr:TIGR01777 family oxidoreductase [Cyanobacteriota bacterium]
MRIAVTGGSGFVGRQLVKSLLAEHHQVQVFTRNPPAAAQVLGTHPQMSLIAYDPLKPLTWSAHLEGIEAVVNLAGEPLAGTRWTPAKKAEIRRSRVEGTRCLVDALGSLQQKPAVMISSSAIGYYGSQQDDRERTESDPPAQDFLGQLSQDWESAAQRVQAFGIRLVILRTGIVLGPDGGALALMVTPFQLFIGGPIGSGQQWLSWIHRDDLVALIKFSLTHPEVAGVLNGTAPHPVQMKDFCQVLGQVIGRPSWIPVPALALEVLLGEAAQVVLTGQRVLPSRAAAAGFTFCYPDLPLALRNIFVNSQEA